VRRHRNPRLNLPAQTVRGCSYGLCAFCTYPGVEGAPRDLGIRQILHVASLAEREAAVLSIKDSLVEPERLVEIAAGVGGRVEWSACTKLSRQLDGGMLRRLHEGGLRTLELGVETMVPSMQLLIHKRQPFDLFRSVIGDAVEAGLSVVVNYIIGFPGEDPHESLEWRLRVEEELEPFGGRVKLSLNDFELERRSPMGENPERYGIVITERWPWSSVVGWKPAAQVCAGAGDPRRLQVIP
jgi:radical SAM superfamily enzyme YgiQ (UPF0313 family)